MRRHKKAAIMGGVALIIAAATAAEKSRGWKDIRKTAVVALLSRIAGKLA